MMEMLTLFQIDGNTRFSDRDQYDKTAEVVITYHVFPEERTVTSSSIENSSTVSESTEVFSSSAERVEDQIITSENNSEFATLLLNGSNQQTYMDFAQKYKGRKIEFDGNIASIAKHGTYNTRCDILIYCGDYSATTAQGVIFQVKDKNITSDLHLTGDNVPDAITEGQNVRMIAMIDKYNEVADFMEITPIETKIR